MNHCHTDIVTPNTSTDSARNRPAALPRRQRIGSALASALISGVLLGSVIYGMTASNDDPQVMAGEPAATTGAGINGA